MAKGDIVVGLDIGTTKVCTVVGEVADEAGQVNILSVGMAPSTGLRRGVVVNIEQTVHAIAESIHAAQESAGAEIHSVVVGVTGEHIASLNARGVIAIQHADREVRLDDVERVLENARTIVLPPDREIIHVIPRGYSLDGQGGVQEPEGMFGSRLEVEAHIVTGATTFLQNVARCVERSDLQVEDLVLEPVATALAVLLPSERDLGVVLVDIGGGTSDIAIFQNGEICYSAVVPVGGQYVTKDIAAGLRTSLEEAERVKRAHGTALPPLLAQPVRFHNGDGSAPAPDGNEAREDSNNDALRTGFAYSHDQGKPVTRWQVDEEETFEFMRLGATETTTLPTRILAEIVEPRMTELFQLVQREIRQSNYVNLLPAGLVLSGGGARLHGVCDLAAEVTGMHTRIGTPIGCGGLADLVADTPYATAVGLVLWGARMQAPLPRRENPTGFLAALTRWMRGVLGERFRRA